MTDRRLDPELLLAHSPFVRSIARSLLRDENDVDDVVQKTWLAAIERPPRAREVGSALRGWLARVVRSTVRDSRRGEQRRTRREQLAAPAEPTFDGDPATAVARLQVLRDVVEAVPELEEPGRSTVIARHFEDLSPSAIAARDGVPVATVETRLRRAREQLRRRLDARHGGDRRALLSALAYWSSTAPTPPTYVAPTAAASGTAATLISGVTAMSITAKSAAAALVVVAAAWVTWNAWPVSKGTSGRGAEWERVSDVAAVDGAATSTSPADAPRADAVATRAADHPIPPSSAITAAGTVTAFVVAKETGEPIPGARVLFRAEVGDAVDRARALHQRSVSQRHRNLKSGEYYLAERREIEAELEATGKAYVADAQGRVELPRFDAAWICARAGDRWLPDCWRTNSSAPVRLELEREVGLRIRVLDSHGVPTIDVPVAVEVEISPGVRAVHWRGTTHGPAGIAEVPWVTFRSSQHFGRRDVFATLGLAGASGSRTKIDVRRLPDAPVDLVMAPHGLVRVEVKDEHGRPFLDEAFVGVGVESDSGHWVVGQTDLIWQQARNGVVELDHVGLGLDLVAFLQVGDDERMPRLTSFHGPVQENELVSIVTTPGDPVPVLTGRLLGPRDEPVRDWTVRANYAITSQGTEERQQTTDEEGWFRLPLTREPWQYTKEWSEFAKNELTLTPDSPEALGAEFVARAATLKLTPEQLEPGVHDLGEIRLVEAPCIAAGVVVDAQGVAQSGLQVVLERHTRNAQTWTFDLNFNQFTGRDGSFRFSGRIEDSSVRATVRDLGWYVPNRVEIRPGTTDARVVVERTGSLRGRLLVDDGVPVDDLSLRLSDELVVPGSFMASPTERVHVANDGSFTIDAVRPAVGSVSVGLGSSALFEELVRVENVTVRGGEPTLDPQLAAVDLRGRLRVIEVHVVDRDGVAVPSAMLKFRPRGALDSTSARLARTDASGLARLTVSTSPTRTTVEHDGFDSTEVSDLASSREIVLTRKK